MINIDLPIVVATQLRCEGREGLVFDLASLTLRPGVTLVQGPEGSGKTSLLRVLAGERHLLGSHLQRAPGTEVYWANPNVAVDEQHSASDYFKTLTAQYAHWSAARLHGFADALGMADHLEKPLYMLSTGTKRKVWLCAAVASGAALTLLDEPFAALDSRSIATVLEVLTEAATTPHRAWVIADYLPPRGVPLTQTIVLGA